jgi:cyclophilin family peptidyl-prolyl cis-trans isomerase
MHMKTTPAALVCTLLFLAMSALAQSSDEVGVMNIQFGKEMKVHPVVIEFYEREAPSTVENFKKLARKKFYNGIAFHRVFPNKLVQTGDPLSRKKDRAKVGTGGPGYTLPPEIRSKHISGAVAMGRLPDNLNPSRLSNGSQFYIVLRPMPSLDGQYTVFGRVISGMDTLQAISMKSADSNNNPVQRIVIKSLKIEPRARAFPQ